MGWWSDAYLAAFLIGLLSTLGLFLLGMGHQGHGHGGHGHGHGGHGHGHGGNGHGHAHGAQATPASDAEPMVGRSGVGGLLGLLLPLLNLTAWLAFLMCGGAAGYVSLRLGQPLFISQLLGIGAGLGGGILIAWITRLLDRAEAGVVTAVDRRGTLGRVIAHIGPGRMGEIAFSGEGGVRKALPARADEAGSTIERETEVVVLRVERGVAYVKASSELFASDDNVPSTTMEKMSK